MACGYCIGQGLATWCEGLLLHSGPGSCTHLGGPAYVVEQCSSCIFRRARGDSVVMCSDELCLRACGVAPTESVLCEGSVGTPILSVLS